MEESLTTWVTIPRHTRLPSLSFCSPSSLPCSPSLLPSSMEEMMITMDRISMELGEQEETDEQWEIRKTSEFAQ